MKTNFLMLSELLDKYCPKERGYINEEEMYVITNTLCLDEMNITQLRNLRDFTVLFLTKDGKDTPLKDWDKMSAITCAIDHYIFRLGGEV